MPCMLEMLPVLQYSNSTSYSASKHEVACCTWLNPLKFLCFYACRRHNALTAAMRQSCQSQAIDAACRGTCCKRTGQHMLYISDQYLHQPPPMSCKLGATLPC